MTSETPATSHTESEYGSTTLMQHGTIQVVGAGEQLRAWARRPGKTWPCSAIARQDMIVATIDARNGDLVDLTVYSPAADMDDITGDELTAWIDDNLAGTPFAHLARNPAEV